MHGGGARGHNLVHLQSVVLNPYFVDALLQKRKERLVCLSNLFVYLMTIILIQKLEGIYPYVCF